MAGQPVRRRRPTRAPHIDYAAAGAYFVTVCAGDRACIFGEVTTLGEVRLSAIGEVVARTLTAVPTRWDGVALDAYVVMPNHVHAIIWLGQGGDDARTSAVGAGRVSAVGAGLVPAHEGVGGVGAGLVPAHEGVGGVGAGLVPAHEGVGGVGAGLVPAHEGVGGVGAGLVPAHDEGRASPSPTAVGCAPDGVPVLDVPRAVGAGLVPALDVPRAVGAGLVPAHDEGRASPSPTAVGCAPDGVSALDVPRAVGAGLVSALDGVGAVGAGLVSALDVPRAVGAGLVPALDEGRASPSPTAVGLATAGRAAPTLSAVVGAFKSLAAHEAGRPLWQRSFHDHVIRDEEDLARLRRYISENPARWSLDELHPDAPTTP